MSRHALVIALSLALFGAVQAHAAAPEPKAAATGQYVDLSPVALPVVVDGKLVNYVFVSVRLALSSTSNAAKWRAKEPYFRDALVRAAHRTPFTNPKDYSTIDTAKLQAALLREATAITGGKDVKSVTVVSQTSKRRAGMPKPRAAQGDVEIRP
jgi:flagellar basal body-associated protein FliL